MAKAFGPEYSPKHAWCVLGIDKSSQGTYRVIAQLAGELR
jgi:hypothetical protein